MFSSKVKFCPKHSFCNSIDASSDRPLKGLGGDLSIVLAAQSQISGTRTEGLRAWRFWESRDFYRSSGPWSQMEGSSSLSVCLHVLTEGARCPGSHKVTRMSQSSNPGWGAPSKQGAYGNSWGAHPALLFFLVLFTDERGSESQADNLPRLCLWCHWAPRHHPTKCHSHLWRGTSKTGMTGVASSLSSPFLGKELNAEEPSFNCLCSSQVVPRAWQASGEPWYFGMFSFIFFLRQPYFEFCYKFIPWKGTGDMCSWKNSGGDGAADGSCLSEVFLYVAYKLKLSWELEI